MQAENISQCQTEDVWFFCKPVSNDLAGLTGRISSGFLVVISPSLQKSPFVLFSTVTRAFFWFSEKNMSFKGCAHLRAPSWAMTCRSGEVCTHFTLCSWPVGPINGGKKKQPTTKPESCMSEENLKRKDSLIQWPDVLKIHEKPFKHHVLHLISFGGISGVATNRTL